MKALILKYNFLEDSDHYVYLLLTPHIGSLESLQHSALVYVKNMLRKEIIFMSLKLWSNKESNFPFMTYND